MNMNIHSVPGSKPYILKNAYTDAPELHPNLLMASLQLLFWLFFHPVAWRNYIARIDPGLSPGFGLIDLVPALWYNVQFRHLLIAYYVVYPLLAGGGSSLFIWLAGGKLYAIVVGITISVIIAVTVGVAGGVAVGEVSGVALVLAFSVAGSVATVVSFSVINGLISGVVIGIAVSIISSVVIGIRTRCWRRSMIAGITASLVSSVAVIMMSGAAFIVVSSVAIATVNGVVSCIVIGIRTRCWRRGMMVAMVSGVVIGIVIGLAVGVAGDMAGGVPGGMAVSALFVLPFILVDRVSSVWASTVAAAVSSGAFLISTTVNGESHTIWIIPLSLLIIVVGLTFELYRSVLFYPLLTLWNIILYRSDLRRSANQSTWLRYHAAFWDEHQQLPWLSLEDYVLFVSEREPDEGAAAIAYLATSRQRWAAQAAQIELDARRLARCTEVASIRIVHSLLVIGELQGPATALLRPFSRFSQDIDAALQQESNYNQRLALSLVEDRLDNLVRELDRSSERYATRFRPIATQWRQAIAEYIHKLAEAIEQSQEIDSPYVIGVPLNEQQEIFVGRTDIGSRIEQLLLDKRRPSLLLYGQRRMGKTSLLNNLVRLLPSTIVPLYVDLQGAPASASDETSLLYNTARAMIDAAQRQRNVALPPLTRDQLHTDPFTTFDEWLDAVERSLGEQTALLMLDEFEALDSAISKGRFDEEDALRMLRHMIQHRPRFKLLLAGSHTLEEYHRWASYLINVQVVQVSYLKVDEARQLVEYPVKDFALRYEPVASQRVIDITRCHTFLVQLLCAEIVVLKNEQDPRMRRFATLADVEAAVLEALKSGSFFFADIERNQVDDSGRIVLRCMAARGEGVVTARELLAQVCPTDLEATLKRLMQRELIEPVDDGYRFQVELIRRWFAQA